MNELTENAKTHAGVVFYDATCHFCTDAVDRLSGLLKAYGFGAAPLLNGADADEMKVVAADGREFGGVEAIIFVAGQIWWARPLTWLAHTPGAMPLLHLLYRRFAAKRHCGNGACQVNIAAGATGARTGFRVPGIFFILGAVVAWGMTDPGFVRMWALAVVSWGAFKLYSMPRGAGLMWWLWPGMGVRAFKMGFPTAALVRLLVGFAVIWGLARHLDPVLAGWCGMLGMILMLHFGVFDLLAWLFQRRPIMDAPWKATTLAAFWGNRWNRAFSDVTRTLLFRPLVRKYGPVTGTMAGFGFSGLLHELVISVPAGAGYGLATGYFLIQGVMVLLERRAGFSPHRGFVWVVVLVPAYGLFHPAFMAVVITPMLTALHAY